MKNLVKKLALFIILSVICSGFFGCSNNATQQQQQQQSSANDNGAVTAGSNNGGGNVSSTPTVSTDAAKNNDYPEVPASIMQAQIESVNGGSYKLADKKGKVVLVNLWGIWCGPCKAEMPHLIELQDKYRDKGFEIIGLNVGDENAEKESAENIKKFAQDMKLNYELGWADDQVYMDFLKLSKFEGVPQSFLIDRDGHLNGVFLGGGKNTVDKLKQTVDKLMAQS